MHLPYIYKQIMNGNLKAIWANCTEPMPEQKIGSNTVHSVVGEFQFRFIPNFMGQSDP